MSALIAGTLSIATMNLISAAVGVALWVGGLFVLRWMAKSDSQLRRVFLRARRYRAYYPARSTPYR